jgi:hypothetical protein
MASSTSINAGLTCDQLQRAVPIHPTVSELIPTLLGDLKTGLTRQLSETNF